MGRPFSQHDPPPAPPAVGVVPTPLPSREPPVARSAGPPPPAEDPPPAPTTVAAFEFCESALGLSAPEEASPPAPPDGWLPWQSWPPVGLIAGAFVITSASFTFTFTFAEASSVVWTLGGRSCKRSDGKRLFSASSSQIETQIRGFSRLSYGYIKLNAQGKNKGNSFDDLNNL